VIRRDIVAASFGDSTSAVSYAISDLTPAADIEHAQANIYAGGAETAELAIAAQPDARRDAIRWSVSAVFAIIFHAAIAMLMLHWQQPAGTSAPAEPIMIELTPVEPASISVPAAEAPASPEHTEDAHDKPFENTPTPPVEEPIADKAEPVQPRQLQTDETKPERPQETIPAEQQVPVIVEMEQKSEVELPAKKQEIAKPVDKKRQEPKRIQSQARTPKPEPAKPAALPQSQSTRTAAAAAAPSGGPSPSDWRSQVIGILERNKRYPSSAESNHQEGTAHLAFTIDRQGRITSAHIAGSSGSAALDAETLALVHRVSIPPPPAEMAGTQISLVVSLRYNIPRY
jgi:periplasmic protein TonB